MANSHGRFVWYELATTDMEASNAFYTGGRGLGHVGGGVVSLGTVFGGGSTQRTAVLAGMKENGTPPL